jgi:hypothetical protein
MFRSTKRDPRTCFPGVVRRLQRGEEYRMEARPGQQKSRHGWTNRQLALKSGTVSANGDVAPAESIDQSRSPSASSAFRPEKLTN